VHEKEEIKRKQGRARMAKLADAADLKSAGRKAVGVQVPLRAPIKSITYIKYFGNYHS
jgi:hypothetical protein